MFESPFAPEGLWDSHTTWTSFWVAHHVRDVEEVTHLVLHLLTFLLDHQVLAQHHDSVGLLAGPWPVTELGHVLTDQSNVLVAFLPHHLFLEGCGARPLLRLHFVLGRPVKPLPGRRRQGRRPGDQVGHGVDAEGKAEALAVPAVQVFGLAEVGIAAQADLEEASAPTKVRCVIQIAGGALMAGTAGGAVEQEQGLLRVGQGNQ
jgi:hypothetical protein